MVKMHTLFRILVRVLKVVSQQSEFAFFVRGFVLRTFYFEEET